MANTFQKILGKGKDPVTEQEREVIYNMLLNGSRKSAVLSTMLEQGFDKEQLKTAIEEQSKRVKEYKKSDDGVKEMIEINKRRVKNGLISIAFGTVLTIGGRIISGAFDWAIYYVFYGAIFWGIFTLIRGLIGLSSYKIKDGKRR